MNEQELREKFLGIPYAENGRNMTGLNCLGLTILAYKVYDIEFLDLENLCKQRWIKDKNKFIEDYYKEWIPVVKTQPRFLDLMMFNENGIPWHLGIYLSYNKFLHCGKAGVVITKLEGRWCNIFEGYYRHNSLVHGYFGVTDPKDMVYGKGPAQVKDVDV